MSRIQIKPFLNSDSSDLRILFENFGLTFFYAQLLEDDPKLILVVAERLRVVTFDAKKDFRTKNPGDDLVDVCMGPLKEFIKKNRKPGDDEDFYTLLDEANKARRLIAHRFFLEHAADLVSEAGRSVVNQHLSKLYVTIRQAYAFSSALREELYSREGLTPELVTEQMEKFMRLVNQPGD
jgi:hypothetical protein